MFWDSVQRFECNKLFSKMPGDLKNSLYVQLQQRSTHLHVLCRFKRRWPCQSPVDLVCSRWVKRQEKNEHKRQKNGRTLFVFCTKKTKNEIRRVFFPKWKKHLNTFGQNRVISLLYFKRINTMSFFSYTFYLNYVFNSIL